MSATGDSDSDWDDDDDFTAKKINIKIKPIAQVTPNKVSASVDELRATVQTWKSSLANINLVKPNSRRHHQSSVQLDNVLNHDEIANHVQLQQVTTRKNTINSNLIISSNSNNNINIINNNNSTDNNNDNSFNAASSQSANLPIAFSVREYLTAKLPNIDSACGCLIGRLYMAVPLEILRMKSIFSDKNLNLMLASYLPWNQIRLNSAFMLKQDSDEIFSASSPSTNKNLMVGMNQVINYVEKQYQKEPNSKYFVLPELLNYSIGSQEKHQSSVNPDKMPKQDVNPLRVLTHWLCDLNATKVRVDISLLDNIIENSNLSASEMTNLEISLVVDGEVLSHQSKPDADWSPIESRLTWRFSNLAELIQASTANGKMSCLARFDLRAGPSKPSDVSLKFSILGKTISGSHVILNDTNNFRLAKQRHELRTGAFTCEPTCI